jgi:phospholipid/cholesterol/gamma-HCH transport system ATP-binding protein
MKFGTRHDIKQIELRDVGLREANGIIWFENVNFVCQADQSVWIKGEVVASHLLKIMSGLVKPTTGQVLINDQDIHELDFEEFLPYRLNLGYTFNLGGILNNRTIKENLMLPFLYHGAAVKYAEQEVLEILQLFDLQKYQDYRPASVPGVVRKLACIGRALAITPQVLLMDDPTSAMKKNAIERLKHWIKVRRLESPLLLLVASEHENIFDEGDHTTLTFENGKVHEIAPAKEAA